MKIDVKHIAKLANLDLKEEEIKKFESQLGEILDFVNKLKEADTKGVETTSQVTNIENVFREDQAKSSLSQEEVLSNATSKHNGLFKVKGIFEE